MDKYKMVCLDIDGTLLNSENEITCENKRVIKLLSKDYNIPIVLVSARMPKGILFLQKELEIEEPIICYSGALVLDKYQNILLNNYIAASEIYKIYEMAIKHNIHISLYKDDAWYVESIDPWALQESEITGIIPEIISFPFIIEEWRKENSGSNKILCMGEPTEINLLKSRMKEEIGNRLNIYPSKPTYLEIMPKSASKTVAIDYLRSKFGIERDSIIAMGDNYNDIDMLEFAGLGIAMGNAPAKVKVSANSVTMTNDESGVAVALEKAIIV